MTRVGIKMMISEWGNHHVLASHGILLSREQPDMKSGDSLDEQLVNWVLVSLLIFRITDFHQLQLRNENGQNQLQNTERKSRTFVQILKSQGILWSPKKMIFRKFSKWFQSKKLYCRFLGLRGPFIVSYISIRSFSSFFFFFSSFFFFPP